MRRWLWRVIGVVGLALLASACHQNGTVFAVDTTEDTVDANPGDGICADAGGFCSLRAAVMEANALPGVEEIRLVDGEEYGVHLDGQPAPEDDASIDDLDIVEGVVITGDGTLVGIAPAGNPDGEAVIHVHEFAGLFELDGPDVSGEARVLVVDGPTTNVIVHHSEMRALVPGAVRVANGHLSVFASTLRGADPLLRVDAGQVHLENTNVFSNYRKWLAIDAQGGTTTIVHSTVNGVVRGPAEGAGTVTVQSSLISGVCTGSVTSLGFNWSAVGLCRSEPTDLDEGPYPTLGPLRDLGGAVETVYMDRDSPAVDAAETGGCTLDDLDARGADRPFGPACDIGALEIDYGTCVVPAGAGADISFCTLPRVDLTGADLRDLRAVGASLPWSSIRNSDLRGAEFQAASLGDVSFEGSDLGGARLVDVQGPIVAPGASLVGADLSGSWLIDLRDADLRDVIAHDALIGAYLGSSRTAWMTGAVVDRADFSTTDFNGVFSGGITGTPAAMRPGTGIVNGYIIDRAVHLESGDFSGVDFTGLLFTNVRSDGADFSEARIPDFSFTWFRNGRLDLADLSDTTGQYASFWNATMVGTDVSGTDLRWSAWDFATVVGVDFTDADLGFAGFDRSFMLWNTFSNTTCPSGVNSDDNGGNCDGQFISGEPLPSDAPVPADAADAIAGLSAADFGVVD